MSIFKTLIASEEKSPEDWEKLEQQFLSECEQEIQHLPDCAFLQEVIYLNNQNFSIFFPVIPIIFREHKLFVRSFKTSCRSCIITDNEVFDMSESLHVFWRNKHWQSFEQDLTVEGEKAIDVLLSKPYEDLEYEYQKIFFEFIYIIPVVLKRMGYEVYRPSEDIFVNESFAETLARSIHTRFRKHIAEKTAADAFEGMYLVDGNRETYEKEFDELSEDFKMANIDNAYHIPTKLLSIGYKIEQVDGVGASKMLELSENEIEVMAFIEHCRWSWERRLSGWVFNKERDNSQKHHNCLIPYEELPAHEQEKDRIMVRFIPALLHDLGLQAVKLSPEQANEIPYVNQHVGFIFNVETKIRNIQSMVVSQRDALEKRIDSLLESCDDIDVLKQNIKNTFQKDITSHLDSIIQTLVKTEEEVKFIKSTYKSGRNVQKTFMPESVELKKYFPNSFILFKPKDIVSGDFYFTAKVDNTVIAIAADCTGHGISGSILSGICYNYLHLAINENKITAPLAILEYVMPKVRDFLKHSHFPISGNSEMELAICSIDLNTLQLSAGCYGRPMYCIKDGDMVVLGKGSGAERTADGYYCNDMQLSAGDTVYAFSDGYTDQLGGERGRKYLSKRFKRKLQQIHDFEMEEQCYELNNEIDNWRMLRGQYETLNTNATPEEQTDDITVIGIRV